MKNHAMKKVPMKKMFYNELKKDNVYKSQGQYIITGKGTSWNNAKADIEAIYKSWIESCELLGQGEDEVISRINKAEISYDFDGSKNTFYFTDRKGIIGEPLICSNTDEEKTDFFLFLLYISSKLSDEAKNKLRCFVKIQYAN